MQATNTNSNSNSSTFLIILLIIGGIVGYYFYSTHSSLPNLSNVTSASHTVTVTVQPLTASQVNTVLCNAKSSACGTGVSLYNDAVKAGIDVTYALAVFKEESSYGTAGIATVTHSLGNIKCTAGYACNAGFRSYASWDIGYADWFTLIQQVYVDQGLTTVATITAKYAPSSDNNNTQQYVDNVNATMSSLSSK